MTDSETLYLQTLRRLPYEPMASQAEALRSLTEFACQRRAGEVFILNGYAGTGKTSLIGALISAMGAYKMRTRVLAPTGRAAKVAEKYSARKASTVHRHIYRHETVNGVITFSLGHNSSVDTLYIIDEASMITDGEGRSMLKDLIRYVYSTAGCGMVLVGDTAQLPPVGQSDSPAMSVERLSGYGLRVRHAELTEIARQQSDSGILMNATKVRQELESGCFGMPELSARYADVRVVSFYDFEDSLSSSWSEVGKEETIIITRSNYRANAINASVRRQVLYSEEPLERGERLVISKNNYYWTREVSGINFLANGETVNVEWIGKLEKAYGFSFADVELRVSGSDKIVSAKLLLESLQSEGPSMPQRQMQEFYKRVCASKEGSENERMMSALEDLHYNALQAKYAYCVTCHKAQGGQWRHVYIDLSSLALDTVEESFLRWLYTALTRATDKVFFVNPSIPVVE